MPLVTVRLIENVFTLKEKAEMVRKLTHAMIEIEGENPREATLVLIEEEKERDGAIGGRILKAADVHNMQCRKAV